MEKHLALSDEQFVELLVTCKLDLSLFSHQAHLRFAWLQIEEYGLAQAIEEVRIKLKRYIYSLGEDCKYNETVTIAAVHAVSRFKQKSTTTNFEDFIKENSVLIDDFKGVILSGYRTDIFQSALAKKEYVAPDGGK